jgi:hypothetical protein
MRGIDVNALVGRGLDPAARRAATGKDQRMHAACLNDRKFKITVVRSRRNPFPYWSVVHRVPISCCVAAP